MFKVRTNYENNSDDQLVAIGQSAKKGLTGNSNYKVSTELSDMSTSMAHFISKRSSVATGTAADVAEKNTAREDLETKLNILAISVNLQAKGNEAILRSSGLPMHKKGEHVTMGEVINFKVKNGKKGEAVLTVENPGYSHHGTVFAFWDIDLGPTPNDINKWFFRPANAHEITIGGLTPGKTYPFAAAYKGKDGEAYVWSAIINKMIGD